MIFKRFIRQIMCKILPVIKVDNVPKQNSSEKKLVTHNNYISSHRTSDDFHLTIGLLPTNQSGL